MRGEALNVVGRATTEGVNALVVVSDCKQPIRLPVAKKLYQPELGLVDILVFIDKKMACPR